jgi:hypothetical protein
MTPEEYRRAAYVKALNRKISAPHRPIRRFILSVLAFPFVIGYLLLWVYALAVMLRG